MNNWPQNAIKYSLSYKTDIFVLSVYFRGVMGGKKSFTGSGFHQVFNRIHYKGTLQLHSTLSGETMFGCATGTF